MTVGSIQLYLLILEPCDKDIRMSTSTSASVLVDKDERPTHWIKF